MKSNMTLNVEFLIGTDLEDAIKEAKEKAVSLNLNYVCFKFNGVSFSIGQNADVDEALKEYRDGNRKYVICHS